MMVLMVTAKNLVKLMKARASSGDDDAVFVPRRPTYLGRYRHRERGAVGRYPWTESRRSRKSPASLAREGCVQPKQKVKSSFVPLPDFAGWAVWAMATAADSEEACFTSSLVDTAAPVVTSCREKSQARILQCHLLQPDGPLTAAGSSKYIQKCFAGSVTQFGILTARVTFFPETAESIPDLQQYLGLR